MTEQQTEKFDNYKYQQQYIKENVKFLHVPFNKKFPDEFAMFEYLDEHAKETGEKKASYIKRLVREDMERQNGVYPAAMQMTAEEIVFPEVNGYEDREAIKTALEKKHVTYTMIRGNFRVEIDAEERKVLTVKDVRRMLVGF